MTGSAVALLLLLWLAVVVLNIAVLLMAAQQERQEVADRIREKTAADHLELEHLYLEERDAP